MQQIDVTNMRIARKVHTGQGTAIKTEVAGSWFVIPEDSQKMIYIRKMLLEYRTADPASKWELETRTNADWFQIK